MASEQLVDCLNRLFAKQARGACCGNPGGKGKGHPFLTGKKKKKAPFVAQLEADEPAAGGKEASAVPSNKERLKAYIKTAQFPPTTQNYFAGVKLGYHRGSQFSDAAIEKVAARVGLSPELVKTAATWRMKNIHPGIWALALGLGIPHVMRAVGEAAGGTDIRGTMQMLSHQPYQYDWAGGTANQPWSVQGRGMGQLLLPAMQTAIDRRRAQNVMDVLMGTRGYSPYGA